MACSYIIVSKLYSLKLKSNLQKLMEEEENVFRAFLECEFEHMALNFNKNRGAVATALEKKRGYLHCLRNVTLLPFIKYTKKGVSDYILCIARV